MEGKIDFSGKVVLVTGAARGIGRETALMFARRGAKVLVNDLEAGVGDGLDAEPAETIAQEIREAGGQAVAHSQSAAGYHGGHAVVEAALDAFGQLDFLINNAGIVRPGRVEELSDNDFQEVVVVTLTGYFATIRAAAESLKKRRGVIVNLGSPSGFGHYGMAAYCAAKEGVVGLSRAVARDLGPFGVRCNVLRPITDDSALVTERLLKIFAESDRFHDAPLTGNISINDMAMPRRTEDVAAVIGWLCSDHSRSINGRELFVSGGQVALVQEPELVRSQFTADGWSIERLCEPAFSRALTWGERNRFAGRRTPNAPP